MDMLHMLDTPMLLDMLVPMVLTLMLELMVPTTLARGQLMLSLRLKLMLSMVPMDILHMLLPMLMDMLLLPMVPTLTWDKKKCFFLQKNYEEKSIHFVPQHEIENFNIKCGKFRVKRTQQQKPSRSCSTG